MAEKIKTVHFIYTVPRSKNSIRRALDKVLSKTNIVPPLHRSGNDFLIGWQHPIRAPHSISYHLLHALKRKYKVKFYSIYEQGICKVQKGDIILAQPIPEGGFGKSRADHDDPRSITSQTLRAFPHNKKISIMPFANDPLLVSWAHDLLKNYSDRIVFIGGKIWTDQLTQSPFHDITHKPMLRVDMGIDMNDYPLVKKSFNPAGKRKYLYIGHTSWYKNTAQLEKIAADMPEYEFGHIGGGTVTGWKKIADFANLTPDYMSSIAKEYDIFVSTSTADAQATTILEQMCFGMTVATTPETGYELYPSLTKLSTTDTAFNVQQLKALQTVEESVLLQQARQNREIAQSRHSWEHFCQTIVNFIEI